jgi:hypothetical protein
MMRAVGTGKWGRTSFFVACPALRSSAASSRLAQATKSDVLRHTEPA